MHLGGIEGKDQPTKVLLVGRDRTLALAAVEQGYPFGHTISYLAPTFHGYLYHHYHCISGRS